MTPIASHITAFLQQRLPIERGAGENTCESYAYAFKLLFEYASSRLKIAPSQLHLEQLHAPLIVDFLDYLETVRGNGANSRNIRLAAIKSFRYVAVFHHPKHAH
jgi:integrase/recombinase XerD